MRVSTICRILGGAALTVACCLPAAAQQKPFYYDSVCVKAKPGRAMDFASQLSGNVLKLEQSRLDAGKIRGFLELEAVIPSGKKSRCDYIIDTFYDGPPPAPMTNEEFAAALHQAGIDMTVKAFWQPIMEDSYLVTRSVGEVRLLIGSGKKGDYEVLNTMDIPDMTECLNTQKKLWQPIAEARMKAGQQSGWGVWQNIYPRGSDVKVRAGSVDIYSSWDQIYLPDLMKTWQEVHPDVKIGDAMAEFEHQCLITRSQVYHVAEYIHAPVQ